ncbi:MAG: hypothetical protein PF630_07455 [Gammaproteobacteria bacterium]|jgi:putative FmdB family regulatory protein|nr:hypothetical protein [Gammaproteobacteria bacterium]
MPIHVYQASGDEHCAQCRNGFEQLEKMSAEPLSNCPQCGAALRRCITAPAVISSDGHLLSPGHIEKHGFTQYKKVGQGEYERTAGSNGPDKLKA